MKKILLIFSVLLLTMTSCLKQGLEDVESSSLCDLSNVEFEYRWAKETLNSSGEPTGVYELHYKGLIVDKTIDKENHKVTIKLNVPNASGDFTNDMRGDVMLSNLTCMFTVSTAASVKPLGDAPKLGKPGDFSDMTYTYRIIAAAGNYTDWVIDIVEFKK